MKALLTRTALILWMLSPVLVAVQEEPGDNQAEEQPFDTGARLADLEEDPHAVVHNVNVITGDYTEAVVDLSLGGNALQLMRFYSSSERRKPRHGTPSGFWEFNHRGYLSNQSDGAYHNYEFRDENGRHALFRRYKKEDQGYPFRLYPYLFQFDQGYTHFPSLQGCPPHPSSSRLYCHKHRADHLVVTGCGDRYSFMDECHSIGKEKGQLIRRIERLNGFALSYYYSNHGDVTKVDLLNRDQQVIHALSFKREEGCLTVMASDGRFMTYCKKVKFGEPCLEVSPSFAPAVTYVYHSKTGKLVRCEGPDGRYLQIDYYETGEERIAGEKYLIGSSDPRRGRVKRLVEPVGPGGKPAATYRFIYEIQKDGSGATRIYDAEGHLILYRYGTDKRISAIEHYDESETLYSRESFDWMIDGKLRTRSFEDGAGTILYCKSYTYDERGNVTCEALYGDLSGHNAIAPELNKRGFPKENGCEVYRKHYQYNRQNLLAEEWDDRTRIRYAYHPSSSLISAKWQYAGKSIRLRHFYEYDKNGAVTLEISDDGNSEDRKDLSRVSERHIRRTLNRQRTLIGLPKQVEESVLDLTTGKEVLIQRQRYSYDTCGRPIKIKLVEGDGNESERCWEYDAFGKVTKATDAMGQSIMRQYDLSGNLIREEGPDPANVHIFAYDDANRLIREETCGGQIVKSWNYDKCGRRISSTDEYGHKTRYLYDTFGRLVETHLPAGIGPDGQREKPVEIRRYNAMGQLIASIQADGSTIHTKSTVRGQPVEVHYPDGSIELQQYSLDGLLLWKRSKLDVVQTYVYDYLGRWIQQDVMNADGLLVQTYARSYRGNQLVRAKDPAGHITDYSYNGAGHLIRMEEGERATLYERDLAGRLRTTYLAGIVKRQSYDKLNRLIEEKVENELGQVQRMALYHYDAAGRRDQVIQGRNRVTTYFNENGDPTTVIDSQGNQTHTLYRYDYSNQQGERVAYSETIDPEGRKTVSIRDVWGRIVRVEQFDALSKQIQTKSFGYDIQGRKTLQNIDGLVTVWQYNSVGQLIRMMESSGTPQQKATTYTYNSCGLLESVTKPDGVALYHHYDPLGRLDGLISSDRTLHESYLYDFLGNLCQAKDHVHGTTTFKRYDRFGNCIQEDLSNGLTLSATYDAANRLLLLTLPDASNVSYTYSGSQLAAVSRNADVHFYTSYDENGHWTSAKLIGKAGDIHLTRDSEGRPLTIQTSCWKATYLYDAVGQLLLRKISDSDGSHDSAYRYDSLGQLIKDSDHTYDCDSRYNLKAIDGRTFVIDGLNQLLDDGDRQYVYDLAGRLIKRSFKGCIQEYAYDALDRLIEVKEAATRYRYLYDHEGRRLSKTLENLLANGEWQVQKVIHYFYHGHSEMGAYEGTHLRELRLLGTGLGAEIGATVAIEFDGCPYAPIHDNNGNIVSLIDSKGHEACMIRYSSFGEASSKGIDCPWGYASKRLDPETGWIYFGKRFYDTHTARWTTPDPIGYKGGPNLYAYVLNNPLTHFDPQGLFLESISAFFWDSCYLFGNTLSLIGDHLVPVPYFREALSYTGRFFSRQSAYHNGYSKNSDLGLSEHNTVRVISVNGMLNRFEDAKVWAENISRYFGDCNVHYSYNSSHGFMLDLLECIAQKLGFHTHCEEKLVQMIREQCQAVGEEGEVHVFAHSQGGQVLSNALSHLSPMERTMLHIATFGSAKMIADKDLGGTVNFINIGDFIPWFSDPIGIMQHSQTLTILQSPLFDHSAINSLSYQKALRKEGDQFRRIYGRL